MAQSQSPTRGDQMLSDYFRAENEKLANRCLTDIKTLDDWNAKRGKYRAELFDMLGLSPLPVKTDLKAVTTGKLEHDEFTVENLHFQSMPNLYVTANLYLPKNVGKPAPAILYVCGHAKVITNGVSFGNKTAYQHHGEWFARHGYVCLVIDTLQLGEIQGIHHGTYREKMWWWNSRGYSPAGVEAWNSIRALDYLETRPEVDKTRFGVTGRSGGGAYSWVLTALDDRIKVAAPVAGITDLQNYLFHAVEGHCDCMFFVNRYRWDYPMLAALSAPRPLLLCNTDKDRIFPLDGIVRLHGKVRDIYSLHKATNNFGLLITEGPHEDTQDLQVPVFRWFNRFLKNSDPVIATPATNFFAPAKLKVFDKLPDDERNTLIQDSFVPVAKVPAVPHTGEQWVAIRDEWMRGLREKVFAGWPEDASTPEVHKAFSASHDGLLFSAYDFVSQSNVTLRLYLLQAVKHRKPQSVTVEVLDETGWREWLAALTGTFSKELAEERKSPGARNKGNHVDLNSLRLVLEKNKGAVALFAPRGIGLTAWGGDERKETHIRRRFMLIGQTLDGMRVWDIARAVEAVRSILPGAKTMTVQATNNMAVNALYAAVFQPVEKLELVNLPDSHQRGPDYLNVMRVLDIPHAVALAGEKSHIVIYSDDISTWQWPRAAAQHLGWSVAIADPQ